MTVTVSGVVPSTGLVYVTVHLDYGVKGTSGYQQGNDGSAASPSTTVANMQSYDFSINGATADLAKICSQNVFNG